MDSSSRAFCMNFDFATNKKLKKKKEEKGTGKPPTLILFMILFMMPKGCDFTAYRGSSDRRSPDIKID